MLTLIVPATELFDESTNEFVYTKETKLQLEHSLVSLKKWESKWNKPFLHSDKNLEETIDYIKCMTITQNVDPAVYLGLTKENLEEIKNYIDKPMTATWFSKESTQSRPNREIITAEIIYYWMISYNIPVEFQKWHLNQLITLIQVFNVKNQKPKKMSKRDLAARNRSLNRARKQKYHTHG